MRLLLLKIALTVLLVLSLFIVLLRLYIANSSNRTESNVTAPLSASKVLPAADKNSSVIKIKTLFKEENKSLESRYRTVASEIMDFVHARERLKKEVNKTAPQPKQFVSRCPQPVQKITVAKKQAQRVTEPAALKPRKPRVVIIMDDVSSVEQAELIRQIPFPVTPSIFPVTSDHPYTREVAQMFPVFMIHTPMEAYRFSSPEEDTLLVDDSMEMIDAQIGRIKEDFPDLVAINNHTGSKFTSDAEAMDKLFCVLGKYGIPFVDSRTSVETKGREMAKLFHRKVYERNIFLDNEDDVSSILEHLRDTVSYAKKHQLAIAICHPKPATFEALMQAAPILEDVDIVTIDELY